MSYYLKIFKMYLIFKKNVTINHNSKYGLKNKK